MQHNSTATPDTCFVSTDRALLDLDAIFAFLSTCYWSPGIPRSRVERGIKHSLCFGVYDPSIARPNATHRSPAAPLPAQVGFARVITDHASFAYLCDVFVLESHRGRGLSKRMIRDILAYPSLQGLRKFCLFTRDAHGLYQQYGFQPRAELANYLEIKDQQSYKFDPKPPLV
jgi:ribosomal protein S18 acetylase RimI-like enzyme